MDRRPNLGVLVPSVNTVIEHDLRWHLPDDVDYTVGRVPLRRSDTAEPLLELQASLPGEATKLGDAGVSAVVLACTAGSMYGPPGRNQELSVLLAAAAHAPAVTATTATLQALQALGARDVAVTTPYLPWVHDMEVAYLRDRGLRVQDFMLQVGPPELLAGVTAAQLCDTVVNGVRALDRLPDAVLVSCANARLFGVITGLEEQLGLPVVTSNQATIWAGLRLLGMSHFPAHWGALASTTEEHS